MIMRVTFPMHEPVPIDEVLEWLVRMRESGFSSDAMVKMGKTTGQRYVMIINEEKQQGGLVPVPRAPKPEVPMWGDD